MKRLAVLFVVLLLMFCVSASYLGLVFGDEDTWKESPEVALLFSHARIEGSFVLYDVANNSFVGFDKDRAEKRFVPASTFKIFNALIGLSVGSVENVDAILPWGGEAQPIKAWEQDMSLRDAMKISNVPIYQELALRTGLTAMRARIIEMGYGNTKIGDAVDRFWLDGPLEISAVEQTRMLAKLAQNKLPFDNDDMAAVRDIVKLEEGHGWTLYGKTGTSSPADKPQLGWWVGWVEKDGNIYSFALNMDFNKPEDATRRTELGRAALEALGVLEP